MRVVDYERSEHGPQRRKTAGRFPRLLHCCCICGKVEPWGSGWTTFCSIRELDDEVPIPKFCSTKCRNKGGVDAQNVTSEMKKKAKDAEWRDPKIIYREASEKEKYAEASYRQQSLRAGIPTNPHPTEERTRDG